MVAGAGASLYASVVEFTTRMGFACIPLEPDSKRPLSGFDLSRYFSQRPSASELRSWFTVNHPTNFAVMCGAVSDNLFVLDFDTSDAYLDFTSLFPSLAQSFTVKTRRGYHVYLRSTHSHLRSRKLRGGELKAHGGYVVGAGSVVRDTHYTVTVDAPIIRLDDTTLQQLLTKLTVTSHRQPLAERLSQQSIALKLVNDYKSQALLIGRNNALYQAATRASYLGITQQTCIDTLASLHAHTVPIAQHPYETPAQRLQEARNTITSAYRYHHIETSKTVGTRNEIGVPNVIREHLLKQRQILVLRLLDGFALAGWDEGKVFSLNDAITLGKSLHIGRNAIIRVVNGNKAFLCSSPPAGEADKSIPNSNPRPTRGRPTTRFYVVPSYKQFAKSLGIALTGSTDKLSVDDLRSNKAYRMALHRELVKRQTPELSNRFLAERLGVSERSLRRYNVALGVVRTPIFGYELLTWSNVHDEGRWGEVRLNQSRRDVVGGRWLQLDGGKRYPAIRGIGLRLLAKGKAVVYCRQMVNRLALPDINPYPPPPFPASGERGEIRAARTVIWRHLRGELADWQGDEFTLPPLEPVSTTVSVPKAKPDDLKVIKGIGKTTAGILRRAGIDSYVKLASVTNFDGIAKLFHNVYLTARQVAFWAQQADLLARGDITPDELASWRYRDWKDYQFELARVKERASDSFKWKLAEEFVDFGWLRYKPNLPDWFSELINQVQKARLL
jgi:predicted flap endonuclease-1-like 5' DNA nuclease